MGLPYSFPNSTLSVMEHDQHVKNAVMLLKEGISEFPNGSPLIEELAEKKDDPSPLAGDFHISADTARSRNLHSPLHLQVNGLVKDPALGSFDNGTDGQCQSSTGTSSRGNSIIQGFANDQEPCSSGNNSNVLLLSTLPTTTTGHSEPRPCEPIVSGDRDGTTTQRKNDPRRAVFCERLLRAKATNSIDYFVPQLETLTPVQTSMVVRKYTKETKSRKAMELPMAMHQFGFADDNSSSKSSRRTAVEASLDHDATDVSDIEEVSTSVPTKKVKWADWTMKFASRDHRVVDCLEDYEVALYALKRRLAEIPDATLLPAVEETCARARPIENVPNRTLCRPAKKQILDYADIQPSTSTSGFAAVDGRVHERISSTTSAPIERKMQAYFHRVAMVPSQTVRKKVNCSVWNNSHEIKEEKRRNGTLRMEEREKRRLREEERERAPLKDANESSDYEDTDIDDVDDEYNPKSALSAKLHKGEKKRRGRPPRDPRENAMPIAKLGRRGSVAVSNVRKSTAYDIDDIYMPDIVALPQKIDYKEIAIPKWSVSDSPNVDTPALEQCSFCRTSLNQKILNSHKTMELDERRRFQAARDRDMGSRKDDKNELPASIGKKNFLSIDSVVDTQDVILPPQSTEVLRPSLARPYSPRQFSLIL